VGSYSGERAEMPSSVDDDILSLSLAPFSLVQMTSKGKRKKGRRLTIHRKRDDPQRKKEIEKKEREREQTHTHTHTHTQRERD
jgi:hypothetical protein